MAKRKTNVQLVKDMMEQSQYGALSQMFIMEAISKYAHACAAADPKIFDNAFISGEAWVGVAKEIKAAMEERYK